MQYAIISRYSLLLFIGCVSHDSSPSLRGREWDGGREPGRLHKRNQLPVADDVNSPSQRTGERCSEERWQNERRQRKRSRSGPGGERDRAALEAGRLPLLALIRLIWGKKKEEKSTTWWGTGTWTWCHMQVQVGLSAAQ